jgi:hypothetical protein
MPKFATGCQTQEKEAFLRTSHYNSNCAKNPRDKVYPCRQDAQFSAQVYGDNIPADLSFLSSPAPRNKIHSNNSRSIVTPWRPAQARFAPGPSWQASLQEQKVRTKLCKEVDWCPVKSYPAHQGKLTRWAHPVVKYRASLNPPTTRTITPPPIKFKMTTQTPGSCLAIQPRFNRPFSPHKQKPT